MQFFAKVATKLWQLMEPLRSVFSNIHPTLGDLWFAAGPYAIAAAALLFLGFLFMLLQRLFRSSFMRKLSIFTNLCAIPAALLWRIAWLYSYEYHQVSYYGDSWYIPASRIPYQLEWISAVNYFLPVIVTAVLAFLFICLSFKKKIKPTEKVKTTAETPNVQGHAERPQDVRQTADASKAEKLAMPKLNLGNISSALTKKGRPLMVTLLPVLAVLHSIGGIAISIICMTRLDKTFIPLIMLVFSIGGIAIALDTAENKERKKLGMDTDCDEFYSSVRHNNAKKRSQMIFFGALFAVLVVLFCVTQIENDSDYFTLVVIIWICYQIGPLALFFEADFSLAPSEIAKKFYSKCAEANIMDLSDPASAKRAALILEGKKDFKSIDSDEVPLYYEYGRRLTINDDKYSVHKAVIALREIEAEERKKLDADLSLTGHNKPYTLLSRERKALGPMQDESEAYTMGQVKEKDWAIAGGIANAIAGPAAGVAVAMDVQRKNADRRAYNQKLQSDVLLHMLIRDTIRETNDTRKWLDALVTKAQYLITDENVNQDELIKRMKVVSGPKQEMTNSGAVRVSVKVTFDTSDIASLTADKLPSYKAIDGSIRADLIKDGQVAGSCCMMLPVFGCESGEEYELKGFCTSTQDTAARYTVEFAPNKLWVMEHLGSEKDRPRDYAMKDDLLQAGLIAKAKGQL